MSDKFRLQVFVLDRAVFSGDVISIIAPGEDGYLGVLAHHAALLTTLGEGALSVETAGETKTYQIKGGFMEVLNNQVTVLADSIQNE
ncbi:MAG: ATP synthase F1 subunit epsilon [Candidatus Sumerlaeota bacterium]|nr:ATP synthase F1 subunit epsilon [Candidatus Sumerlaeota bacterium]